jgi:hypothetical protein
VVALFRVCGPNCKVAAGFGKDRGCRSGTAGALASCRVCGSGTEGALAPCRAARLRTRRLRRRRAPNVRSWLPPRPPCRGRRSSPPRGTLPKLLNFPDPPNPRLAESPSRIPRRYSPLVAPAAPSLSRQEKLALTRNASETSELPRAPESLTRRITFENSQTIQSARGSRRALPIAERSPLPREADPDRCYACCVRVISR